MTPNIVVTNNGLRSSSDWAEMATRKIIYIGDESTAEVREQLNAFRDSVRRTIENYIAMAVEERRSWDAQIAEQGGNPVIGIAIRNG